MYLRLSTLYARISFLEIHALTVDCLTPSILATSGTVNVLWLGIGELFIPLGSLMLQHL